MDIQNIINSIQKIKEGIDKASVEDLIKYRRVIDDVRLWEINTTMELCRLGNMVHDVDVEIGNKLKELSADVSLK